MPQTARIHPREAIYVPPRPSPGPGPIEEPVPGPSIIPTAVALGLIVVALLGTRRWKRSAASVPRSSPSLPPKPAEIVDRAHAEARSRLAAHDPLRYPQSLTTEELVLAIGADDRLPVALVSSLRGYLGESDRVRYSGAVEAEAAEALRAWSVELVTTLPRRVDKGARSRINGK